MTTTDLNTTILVDQSPEEVFNAINNVRGWWSQTLEGDTHRVGDEFIYRYKDLHYSKQRVMELIPGKKVVWQVTEARLYFLENQEEWVDTRIIFDISEKGDKTEIRFTHVGLTPQSECFEACTGGWGMYINDSLQSLITTGKGSYEGK